MWKRFLTIVGFIWVITGVPAVILHALAGQPPIWLWVYAVGPMIAAAIYWLFTGKHPMEEILE
jgi:cytosine/uracil/thiamine/allantoin permease